jgi:hypothetical protein
MADAQHPGSKQSIPDPTPPADAPVSFTDVHFDPALLSSEQRGTSTGNMETKTISRSEAKQEERR